MVIAREGEELVCPKGTICGRMTRDANDQITDGDFGMLETCVSPDGQRYVCACCARTVAVRGTPNSNAVSPNASPGPSRATSAPPLVTRTSPLRTT